MSDRLFNSEELAAIRQAISDRRAEINLFNLVQFAVAAIAAYACGEISSKAITAPVESAPRLALMSLWYAIAIPGIATLCGFLLHRCGRFIDLELARIPVEQKVLLSDWEGWKNNHPYNWLVPVGAIVAAVALLYPLRIDLGILWDAGWMTEIVLALLSLGVLIVLALVGPRLARAH